MTLTIEIPEAARVIPDLRERLLSFIQGQIAKEERESSAQAQPNLTNAREPAQQTEQTRLLSHVRALRGSLRLPEGFTDKELVADARAEKYVRR